jgi:quinol monooxygenase YgiN
MADESSVHGRVVVVGQIHTLLGRREELLELLRDTQERSREELGCVSYDFAEAVGDPGRFVVVEEWRDAAAMESHFRSGAYSDYQARIGDLLARPSEVRIHHVRETLRPEGGEPLDPRRAG